MKLFLEKVRKPEKKLSVKYQIIETLGIVLFGLALGVLQKWMDTLPESEFPKIIQPLNISNYLGRCPEVEPARQYWILSLCIRCLAMIIKLL